MMSDTASALRAIEQLNFKVPPGGAVPLMVRFALSKVAQRRTNPSSSQVSGIDAGSVLASDSSSWRGPIFDCPIPMRSVILRKLVPGVREADVAGIFAAFGPIESISLLPEAGEDSLSALVVLSSPSHAQQALMHLSQTSGQHFAVQLASDILPLAAPDIRITPGLAAGVSSLPPGEAGQPAMHPNLYVSNIPDTWDELALRAHFSQVGTVLQCRVLPPKAVAPGLSGLVMMSDTASALRAIEQLNFKVPPGGAVPLMVRFALRSS
jgi:RNA recognition motif-containing protein